MPCTTEVKRGDIVRTPSGCGYVTKVGKHRVHVRSNYGLDHRYEPAEVKLEPPLSLMYYVLPRVSTSHTRWPQPEPKHSFIYGVLAPVRGVFLLVGAWWGLISVALFCLAVYGLQQLF